MRVFFRVDASLEIGTGHVMRCLTLADVLKAKGVECYFICREHVGNIIEYVRSKGYSTYVLPLLCPVRAKFLGGSASSITSKLAHSDWLGAAQEYDAAECSAILGQLQPDWLIVDHYALDATWEKILKPYYRKLMVIDDLADRMHQCDLLLDQTFGRGPEHYMRWVPTGCTLLCGSQYALLRPEFCELRPYSLHRRAYPKLDRLFISMGGVDNANVTGQVLQALEFVKLPAACQITVVLGATAPWIADVSLQATQMSWPTTVMVGVNNMAKLMADSDLAIGAGGATSWERCCLGLPAVVIVLADNQLHVAHELEQAGALSLLKSSKQIMEHLPRLLRKLVISPTQRSAMSQVASRITGGDGATKVIEYLRC